MPLIMSIHWEKDVDDVEPLRIEIERQKQLAAITENGVRRTLKGLAHNLDDIFRERQDAMKEYCTPASSAVISTRPT